MITNRDIYKNKVIKNENSNQNVCIKSLYRHVNTFKNILLSIY